MKKFTSFVAEVAKKQAEKALKSSTTSNSTTSTAVYQPKAPAALKKFSKVK